MTARQDDDVPVSISSDIALRSRRSLDRDPDLMPHPVLASEDPLDNLDHRLMLLGRSRGGGSFVVCGRDIGQQVACILFANDFEVCQRE
jgi:hypothetical protein